MQTLSEKAMGCIRAMQQNEVNESATYAAIASSSKAHANADTCQGKSLDSGVAMPAVSGISAVACISADALASGSTSSDDGALFDQAAGKAESILRIDGRCACLAAGSIAALAVASIATIAAVTAIAARARSI